MSVNTDRIRYLFRQYVQKTCSEEEMQELFAFIAKPQNRPFVEELMDAEYEGLFPVAGGQEPDWEHMFELAVLPKREKQVTVSQVKKLLWMRLAAAAIVVIAVGVMGYWLI